MQKLLKVFSKAAWMRCEAGTSPAYRGASMKMVKVSVLSMLIVAGLMLLAPSLQSAVVFTPGTVNDLSGASTVNVPINVQGFANVDSFQFCLTWDNTSILTSPTITNPNSALSGGVISPFSPQDGYLNIIWYAASGATVGNNESIFSVQFTVLTAGSTTLSFLDPVTPGFTEAKISFYPDTTGLVTLNSGSVTVVPEPINCALALFLCVFAGTATVRKISANRKASQVG